MILEARRPLRLAAEDAEAFRELFPPSSYEQWDIAGSVRRGKAICGDVEHVVIPLFGDKPGAGLFVERVNLLWHRLDELVADGTVTKHLYGATGFRWGQKYRGVDFRGFNHEIFTADAETWPSILAIRTGPAEFSQRLVANLLRQNRRNIDGRVWTCVECQQCKRASVPGGVCKNCDGTGLVPIEALRCEDEKHYFALCGMKWIEPKERA